MSKDDLTPRERRAIARTAAEEHDGVLPRVALRELGIGRNMVHREIDAERWASHGNQTVAVHTGALSELARRWQAVWEVGRSVAALDGVTALQHAGMTGFVEETVHVSVKHTVEVEGVEGVHVHKVIRRVESEVVGSGSSGCEPALISLMRWRASPGATAGSSSTSWLMTSPMAPTRSANSTSSLGWRLVPERYLDQVCAAYWSRKRRAA